MVDELIVPDVSDRKCPKCGGSVSMNRELMTAQCRECGETADSHDWGLPD